MALDRDPDLTGSEQVPIARTMRVAWERYPFSQLPKADLFDLLVFPCWPIFSGGAKRLTFYFWVLWASEFFLEPKGVTMETSSMLPLGGAFWAGSFN